MQAALHAIEARLDRRRARRRRPPRTSASARASPTDADRAVAEAGWSLYCLESRPTRRSSSTSALTSISRSAFVTSQFRLRAARCVPLDALPTSPPTVPPPRHLILVFSIGRCGTTWSTRCSTRSTASGPLRARLRFDLDAAREPRRGGERLLALHPPAVRRPPDARHHARRQVRAGPVQPTGFHASFPMPLCLHVPGRRARWARSFWHMLANFGLPPMLDRETRTFLRLDQVGEHRPARRSGIVVMEAEAVYPEELLAATWALRPRRVPAPACRRRAVPAAPLRRTRSRPRASHRAPAAPLRPAADGGPAALRAFDRDSQAGTAIARDHRVASFGPDEPRPLPARPWRGARRQRRPTDCRMPMRRT